jgi:hypothetical protein
METTEEMMSLIKDYVKQERARQGIINVDTAIKSELSGEAFGEMVMLLDRQLMTTEIGYGSWVELKDFEVLRGVYLLVKRRMGH